MAPFAVLLALAAALAGDPPPAAPGAEARVAFPNRTLREFVPDATRDDAVYLQDHRRNWYHATLAGPCQALRWAYTLAVDTHGGSRLDDTSDLIVRGGVCSIERLVHSAAPTVSPRVGRAPKPATPKH